MQGIFLAIIYHISKSLPMEMGYINQWYSLALQM